MKQSILVVMNDTSHSTMAVDFLARLPLVFSEVQVTLMHVFRKPSGSEEMMGKKFMQAQQEKTEMAMSSARRRLMEAGYLADHIHIHLETEPYATVADGIIAEIGKGRYDIVVISRRKMSRSEEFVLGDASIKVIRALDQAAVVVVKC
ncbi:hypothetical protein DSCO28_29310 [Desulfosarcina ovata subsp. sediminis]|uniref:UspA domain-containing protein n=1 Tax=Desulfosarcina ovata subsp. sediminis TaxID=885957 RepID=A0A5K7ZNY0_9BACT|nr:universal stress protein [Desulfosarcina ovata]BBO82365.1 hypothetical protein DSCO28_29310 [Desulfosarcina ovata subsp. sediminis]